MGHSPTVVERRTIRVNEALTRMLPLSAHGNAQPIGAGVVADLPDVELALVARATFHRQREFAAGRQSARRVLAEAGHPNWSIARGSRGEPLWPRGFVGSISHGAGIAAAAVAPRSPTLAGMGIDVELAESLDPSMWASVLHPAEQLDCRRSGEPATSATATFSAKEAVIKAHYPLTNIALDFLDIHVEVDPIVGAGHLTAWHVRRSDLSQRSASARIGGVRYEIVDDVVVTVALIP